MTIPDKNILVTGGTGFVGSYVIRDLIVKGYRVTAIRRTRSTPFYIDPVILEKVSWIEGDIMDTMLLHELMQEADAVIHAAAKVSFSSSDREELMNTNISGTANVVNAAIENSVKRFVYVSSVAAFGRSKKMEVTEKQVWEENKLNTSYAISKFRAEMEVWRGIAEGLNAVIVNPSTILGYGNWNRSSNTLFKNMYKGFPWYTNGTNGFVDVEDVSAVIVALMESTVSAERFIVNGQNWSYHQLLDTIADGFNKKRPYLEATPFLAGLAWRAEKIKSVFTGNKPLLTRESARIAQGYTVFGNNKILTALPGFTFTPLNETIQKACIRYLANIQV